MFENLIFVFIIGFLSGVGFLSILFFLRKTKSSEIKDDTDLISLKNHMQSIQQSLQNFNLAQDRIENTLIRGGALQQGPWGEFVLKNILDSVGLREGEEYSTQKTFRDEDGNFGLFTLNNNQIPVNFFKNNFKFFIFSNASIIRQKNSKITGWIDIGLSIRLKALLRLVLTKFLLSSLGFFLYFSQFSKVFLVRVLTVDLYDLLIKRFLSAICILFLADLLLATECT